MHLVNGALARQVVSRATARHLKLQTDRAAACDDIKAYRRRLQRAQLVPVKPLPTMSAYTTLDHTSYAGE